MNVHVSPASTPATLPAARQSIQAARTADQAALAKVLAILQLPADAPLATLDIVTLAQLHDFAIGEVARAPAAKRQAFRNAQGSIYERLLRATAAMPAESALQLQAILDEAGPRARSTSAICNNAELGRIVKRLAVLLAKEPADANLVALGRELRDAMTAEIEAEKHVPADGDINQDRGYMAAFHRCRELVEQIETLPATTIDGFGAKMLAFRWARGDFWLSPEKRAEMTDKNVLEALSMDMLKAAGLMPSVAARMPGELIEA